MPNCEQRVPPADTSRDGRRCLKRCVAPKTRNEATQRCIRPRVAGTRKYVYSEEELGVMRAACPHGMSTKTNKCFKSACKIGTQRWLPTGRCRRDRGGPRARENGQDDVWDELLAAVARRPDPPPPPRARHTPPRDPPPARNTPPRDPPRARTPPPDGLMSVEEMMDAWRD